MLNRPCFRHIQPKQAIIIFLENTMLKKSKIFVLAFFVIFACSKSQVNTTPIEISPLLKSILTSHVSNVKQDDWFSPEFNARVLDSFFTSLDQNKYFFYHSDILKYRNDPPDLRTHFRTNSYPFIFEIFNDLYKKRHDDAKQIALELIDAPHDFTIDEYILLDRERINYAKDEKELRERWRRYVKLRLLNHLSAGRDLDDAREKLKRQLQRQADRVAETQTEAIKARFINAFGATLDPHTNFLTTAENNQFLMTINLRLEGIGARLRSEDGFTVVESIISGSPASRLPPELELMPNDKIIAVAQGKAEPVDVIDYDLSDVVALIRGKKGTTVRLTVLREVKGSTTPVRLVIPIVRDRITLEDDAVKATIKETESNGKTHKIGYIVMRSFYNDERTRRRCSKDLSDRLQECIEAGVSAIILDLRGNSGGALPEAVNVASLFIEQGPIVQIKAANSPPQVLNTNTYRTFGVGNKLTRWDGPLVVLVDKFSASASEILAGAIRDYRRGIVIGPDNTFGKGTVQSYMQLPFGASKVTTHLFYQPSGLSNQLYGIAPHIVVPHLSAVWDVGEHKYPNPLRWTPIEGGAAFTPTNHVNDAIVFRLRTRSRQRMAKDPAYRELETKINQFRAQLNRRTISLKRAPDEREREKEMRESFSKRDRDNEIDLDTDIFLREVFRITEDLINETNK